VTTIRQSTFDKSVASLRSKFPNPDHARAAVEAFSEGWEVLPDDHPSFRQAVPKQAVAPVITAPASKLAASTSKADAEVRDLAARLIAQGQTVDQAEANARRSIAYRTGEAYTATQTDIDGMSKDEFLTYVNAGGELPDDSPDPLSDEVLTDEVTADFLKGRGIDPADLGKGFEGINEGAEAVVQRRNILRQAREAHAEQVKRFGENAVPLEAFIRSAEQKAAIKPGSVQALLDAQKGKPLDEQRALMGIQTPAGEE
jgi:hypothetical protein